MDEVLARSSVNDWAVFRIVRVAIVESLILLKIDRFVTVCIVVFLLAAWRMTRMRRFRRAVLGSI